MKAVIKALVIIGLWAGTTVAQAGLVTLVGDTINYEYDDSQAALALFGTPTIVGDVVVFVPPAYRAESLNGSPSSVTTLAEFVFSSVYSSSLGGFLGPVQVIESGDYGIGGGGIVKARVDVRIDDNNSSFVYQGFAEISDSGDSDVAQMWDIGASFNAGPLTDMQIILANELTAYSDAVARYGWIQKKLLMVTAAPNILVLPPGEIPAPGVVMLMGLGLVALGMSRRRKSKPFFC